MERLDLHLPESLTVRSEIHALLARLERSHLQTLPGAAIGSLEAEQVRRVIFLALPSEDAMAAAGSRLLILPLGVRRRVVLWT